ncbi:hypothetical protein L6452_05845 [Arctium lappa]|uniref:Uncharacterized protein n=1 Tax=Arctium lappa TaxID=4217 RepID=A0ACB9EHU5_ARCLA|nr:hypothetical protein L6452_05845 [Arctium lappa]
MNMRVVKESRAEGAANMGEKVGGDTQVMEQVQDGALKSIPGLVEVFGPNNKVLPTSEKAQLAKPLSLDSDQEKGSSFELGPNDKNRPSLADDFKTSGSQGSPSKINSDGNQE